MTDSAPMSSLTRFISGRDKHENIIVNAATENAITYEGGDVQLPCSSTSRSNIPLDSAQWWPISPRTHANEDDVQDNILVNHILNIMTSPL